MNEGWIPACKAEEVAAEDVLRFDYADRTFAIYRTADDRYYATEGLCTHGKVHLADGLVMGGLIECPKHNGQFDFTTGQPKRAPACAKLKTFPVKLESGQVFIRPD
jgi:3-phenylpropionate/trans-cinnamate dioxygenase ferredoxin component